MLRQSELALRDADALVFRRKQNRERLAQKFGFGVAKDALDGAVPTGNPVIWIDKEDGAVGQVLDQELYRFPVFAAPVSIAGKRTWPTVHGIFTRTARKRRV